MPKKNVRAFVDAARMKGMLQHYDLGGVAMPTSLASGSTGASGLAPNQSLGTPASASQSPLPLSNLIGNNPYQAQLAPTTQVNYAPTISAASGNALAGYGQAQGNISNEQALEQQLMAEGQGQGPNPAQAQLAQNTSTNVANQAALMAGQRGAGANAGLIAREAAQQGAATQQGAVGQAATMQAQQQLAAQQGALAAQGQIGNQVTNEQGVNANLFGTAAGATNTQNANVISNYGQAQGINAQASQNNANMTGQTAGGIFQGASSMSSMFALADGGQVGQDGTAIDTEKAKAISQGFNSATAYNPPPTPAPQPVAANYAEGGPVSWVGQFLNGSPSQAGGFQGSVGSVAAPVDPTLQSGNKTTTQNGGQKDPTGGISDTGDAESTEGGGAAAGVSAGDVSGLGLSKGGKVSHKKVPAMLSPGEEYLPPNKAKAVAQGKADPMSGKHVKGKAKVPGDSLKNDTVPAELEEGGVVVKRSVMATHDPEKVSKFVQAVLAKSGMKRKSK